jgi:hypothetical protein
MKGNIPDQAPREKRLRADHTSIVCAGAQRRLDMAHIDEDPRNPRLCAVCGDKHKRNVNGAAMALCPACAAETQREMLMALGIPRKTALIVQ